MFLFLPFFNMLIVSHPARLVVEQETVQVFSTGQSLGKEDYLLQLQSGSVVSASALWEKTEMASVQICAQTCQYSSNVSSAAVSFMITS